MEADNDLAIPDIHNEPLKIQRAKEAYSSFEKIEDKPTKVEIFFWYFYGLCSYSIHTVLIPIIFPLVISQIKPLPSPPPLDGWSQSHRGIPCAPKQMQLYEGLIHPSIRLGNSKFSSLEWTALSWLAGLVLAAPVLGYIATHLDHGRNQPLVLAGATAFGALFCLPTGFFRLTWIFPPYIAAIVVAYTVATAAHTRHLGLMVRGFTGPGARKTQFSDRLSVSSLLSLFSTAAGSIGAGTISAFTYHMLRGSDSSDKLVNLWVVSIFTGLKWFAGIIHAVVATRPGSPTTSPTPAWTHLLSIFKYPHAAGTLTGVFLSSFTTMCIFTGGMLFVVGDLCLKPISLLYFWLVYFIFPSLSLPGLHPLQKLIKSDAMRMQLLGFLLSAFTSGMGFYFQKHNWDRLHVLLFAALQSTSTGILHAFGRVLLLDCSPPGKEGAFSVWFAWVRALGMCAGFAVASTSAGNVSRSFGISFCTTVVGMCVLIFGNVGSFGGAVAAGHVRENVSEKGSPVKGLDDSNGGRN